jgi:hypothetical protein
MMEKAAEAEILSGNHLNVDRFHNNYLIASIDRGEVNGERYWFVQKEKVMYTAGLRLSVSHCQY